MSDCLTLRETDNNKPLATYKDSKGNKKYIYYNENNNVNNEDELTDEEILNIIENFINEDKGRISMRQINELYEALKNDIEPDNKKLKILYNDLKKASNKNKNINIDNGTVMPIFDKDEERKVFYIAGMSGSGKSYFTSKLIDQYKKMYPNNNIILFSNKPEDPALDRHKKLIRIELNEDLLNDPLELGELKNSLVIFDDVEYTPNKYIGEELDRIRDLILQQGRSYKISFCYISHQLTNYKHSRVILNECHACVLFPKMTTTYALKYLLEKYFGFNKKDIGKLKLLPSRWVCIQKIPPAVIYCNGVYLVD